MPPHLMYEIQGIAPRALCILGDHSANQPHPSLISSPLMSYLMVSRQSWWQELGMMCFFKPLSQSAMGRLFLQWTTVPSTTIGGPALGQHLRSQRLG